MSNEYLITHYSIFLLDVKFKLEFILGEWQLSDAKSLADNINNINIWNNTRDYLTYPYGEKMEKIYTMVLEKPKPSAEWL